MEVRNKIIFNSIQDLTKARFYLFSKDVYCNFDIDEIPDDLLMSLKWQNNHIMRLESSDK